MIKRKRMLGVIMLGFIGCAGITHPGKQFSFRNDREIYHFDWNAKPPSTPSEHFGSEPLFLEIKEPVMNRFNYRLIARFLVNREYQQVTIYEVVMVYREEEYTLSKDVEIFRMANNRAFLNDNYKTEDGYWYVEAEIRDQEQRERLNPDKDNRGSTIIPVIDFLTIFKERKAGVIFPVDIRVTYQLDEEEIVTQTSHFRVMVYKEKYDIPAPV